MVSGRASVILVGFSHSNPAVCREVLHELINAYVNLHAKIHLSGATYDLIAKETDERKLRLRQTQEELQKLRSEMGGVSLEDAKETVAAEISNLRTAILEAESRLAEAEASDTTQPVREVVETNLVSNSADRASSDGKSMQGALVLGTEPTVTTSAAVTESEQLTYRSLLQRLSGLRVREQDYLVRFTEENPLVQSVRTQIADLEARRQQMLENNPRLELTESPPVVTSVGGLPVISAEPRINVPGLKARIRVLREQLDKAHVESLHLSDLEKRMADIQLNQQIQEENLRYLATKLEQSRYDSAMESGKNSNINVLQEPSDPWIYKKAMQKKAAMVFVGLAGGGLALAFLLELILDPRIKRTIQLEEKVRLPVYVTIPQYASRLKSPIGRTLAEGSRGLLSGPTADSVGPGSNHVPEEVVAPAEGEASRSFMEALRDRLIVYFERVNLRRKPKLVGVTACHGKAGISMVAEGLASTLSETGGGKVLLVDLNRGQEAMQTYHMGRASAALPDLLQEAEDGGSSTKEDRLYVASFGRTNGDPHPTRSREFDMLIPRLKASDFDYIVFDMPPLTPTSITFRVAGFLDKVLLVAESERTHINSLKQTVALLEETNSRVALVMNKTREYMPKWLRPPQ
jgi:uncharacterized protein involved in exopolysaccharide biosynthesis/Mrp family chromosome partitioning ATPase